MGNFCVSTCMLLAALVNVGWTSAALFGVWATIGNVDVEIVDGAFDDHSFIKTARISSSIAFASAIVLVCFSLLGCCYKMGCYVGAVMTSCVGAASSMIAFGVFAANLYDLRERDLIEVDYEFGFALQIVATANFTFCICLSLVARVDLEEADTLAKEKEEESKSEQKDQPKHDLSKQ